MELKNDLYTVLRCEPAHNVLIDELSSFFIQRVCVLKNSKQVFDDEPWIEALLKKAEIRDGARKLNNFEFVKSHEEPGVQLSDVVVGLLGKYFTFLTHTERDDIVAARRALLEDHQKNEFFLQI